jgi:uncharacterized protein
MARGAKDYRARVVDAELEELTAALPAVAIVGAKGIGKTATASRLASTVYALDDPAERSVATADPARLLDSDPPILIDEWQYLPETWDLVRRAVDAGADSGRFLLTGSATLSEAETHSGAGRIVGIQMRPLALSERGIEEGSVSLSTLLAGGRPAIEGRTELRLEDYVAEILRSGFPGLRHLGGRPLRAQLDGYLDRIIDRDFPELGHPVRNPTALRRWLAAYAAASSTTTSFEKIRDAATGGEGEKPAKTTVGPFRDVLERLWILDPVPAWMPSRNRIRRLGSPPKHQLVDPALAARLLGLDADALLAGRDAGPPILRDGPVLGALFESLCTQSLRVYAQAAEAGVFHLRTGGGEHEVDLIVERGDERVIAIEFKLARDIGDNDVRHLKWLERQLGDELLDAVIVTTGPEAYRRPDGIAVIPAGLLGV